MGLPLKSTLFVCTLCSRYDSSIVSTAMSVARRSRASRPMLAARRTPTGWADECNGWADEPSAAYFSPST